MYVFAYLIKFTIHMYKELLVYRIIYILYTYTYMYKELHF